MSEELDENGLTAFDREIIAEWIAERDKPKDPNQKVDIKNTADLSNEEMIEILKRAKKIQNESRVIKRSIEQDFGKGSVRNQPCPNCKTKLKKCKCGFLEKNLK